MEGWIFKNGASKDGDNYDGRPAGGRGHLLFTISEGGRVEGWIFKKGQAEMVITLGWEGGRVDFQKRGKQRWL